MAQDEPSKNLNSNIHAIMNGEEETEETGTNEDDQDEQSPTKKRGGSSKTTTRKKGALRQVSPQEQGATKEKATTFADQFVHPYSRIILELAITLKSDKAFEEFTQALMAFITNAQIVDSKFIINPLNPRSNDKAITMKCEISPNMTKLSTHIKISGRGDAFNKQKVWDKGGEDDKNSGRKNRKANKKEDEYRDPTVYFSMVVSSEVDPQEIIERTNHEWARANGTRLQIKDLQYVDSETVVTVFKVSTQIPKAVIMAEFKKILVGAQQMARDDFMEEENYDFTMELDVAVGETLPPMNLRIQNAKLRGQDVSTFNKLSHRAQYARKSWHLEVASKYATKMKGLVQMAKEYGIVEQYWGRHAHVSEVTDQKSTPREAKRQVDVAQAHTNYQVSMICEELLGVIDLDEAKDIYHPTSGKNLGTYSLRYVLLNYLKMEDGRPMIAEAHQEDILKPTHIIIPNTPEAERMVGMMNKNLPAFLWYMLTEQGLPDQFIKDLANASCEASMLAEVTKCTWDAESRTLTTEDEMNREEEAKTFEGASWFKDEFGLLAKGSKQKKYAAPEALFNLDGGGSVKTIHDRHNKPSVPQGTPPRKQKEKEVVDMVQTPTKKVKGKGITREVTDLTSETDRDSASQTSESSSAEEEEKKEDEDNDSSSKEGSRSTTYNEEEDDQGATGGG
jgi:hypothetical protein